MKMTERIKAARYAELVRRYRMPKKSDGDLIFANRRMSELRKLFRFRHGMELSKIELDSMIFQKVKAPFGSSAEALGNLVELTFEEKVTLDIRTIRCMDKSHWEVADFYRDRRRARDREKKREFRAQEKNERAARKDLDVREEVLFLSITSVWITVSQIMLGIGGFKAWKGPNRHSLSQGSLRRAINRGLNRLASKGLIESKLETGARGQPVRFVRRIT
jgi:hypothetical protein